MHDWVTDRPAGRVRLGYGGDLVLPLGCTASIGHPTARMVHDGASFAAQNRFSFLQGTITERTESLQVDGKPTFSAP
ncbi:MAG: hypothetical protein ABI939_08190, partial [Anaerolineaceae bacterium]